jgi:hypothetical protein
MAFIPCWWSCFILSPGEEKRKRGERGKKKEKTKEKKEEERSLHQPGLQFGSFLKILSQDSRLVTKGRQGSPDDQNYPMTVSLKATFSKRLAQSVSL